MNIKEAIEKCKMFINNGANIQTIQSTKEGINFASYDTTAIETVLTELKKNEIICENLKTYNKGTKEALKIFEAELEKKDKIINLMAEQLTTDIHSKEWVIDYYEREVEK